MAGQVLLQQPEELLVAPALLDQCRDGLAHHLGNGAALGLGRGALRISRG